MGNAERRWMVCGVALTFGLFSAGFAAAAGRPAPSFLSVTTSQSIVATGQGLSVSARLSDASQAGIAGQPVNFTLGANACSAATDSNGFASCSLSTAVQASAYVSVVASFAGSNDRQASSGSTGVLLYEYPDAGSFVIADNQAFIGNQVTFWGAQWAKANMPSAPASFKGYADSSPAPSCGGSFSTLPGNSSKPPAAVPQFLAVITSSAINKTGNSIRGDVLQIVIVQTNPGYAGDPGHAGTGTVVAVICPSQEVD